jgi:hypothetical protein
LTISGTSTIVRFADSKEVYDVPERYPIGITVEPGGNLIIGGATLKGYDCSGVEKMWDGINIEGNYDGTNMANTTIKGTCTMAGAKILNARQGIVASGVWVGTTTSNGTPYGGTGSQSVVQTSTLYHGGPFGGGLIKAYNCQFINNKRSAIFMQFPHNLNQSVFQGCKFISDGPLVDPNELLQPIPNNYNYNEPRGTTTHVSIWNTRVQFLSCQFSGSTSIIPDYRPIGIEGDDPKIVVNGGKMSDLKVGIECRGSLGGILANVNTDEMTFDDVVQSINLRNSVADMVQHCHFNNIPEPNTFAGMSPSGIFGQYNKAALIQNNDFHGVNSGKPSYGVVEQNTLYQGCQIKENQFFSSNIGSQFEGGNTALTASCNDYTGMGLCGWYCAVVGGLGKLADQGSLFLGEKADNAFFDVCTGASNIDIDADDNFSPFSYYDKTGNLHHADPLCSKDLVDVEIDNNSGERICSPPITPSPCQDPSCDRLAIFLGSTRTITDRNEAIRGLIHTGLTVDTLDQPANYDDALTVLRTRNQIEDRIILIGSLASMGRNAEAITENALLSTSNSEAAACKAYFSNVLDAGTPLTSLPDANYHTALNSLSDVNVSTRAMAETLSHLKDGTDYPLIAAAPQIRSHLRSSSDVLTSSQPGGVVVSPNPFSSIVKFNLEGLDQHTRYSVVITDLLGKVLEVLHSVGGQDLIWHAGQAPNGQYFYQIRTEKEVVQSGKLVKSDN